MEQVHYEIDAVVFLPAGLTVFPLPESAEEKVCVSLCGSAVK
jgi:hypothetical protein